MNPSTLIGMIASVVLLAVLILFAADDPWLFIDLPSIGIVLVGTMAATFLSYPMKEVLRVFGLIRIVMRNERLYTQKDIEELVDISRLWMRDDPVAVERALPRVTNPFLRTGVQLVIDRIPEEDILDLLQWRISRMKAKEAAEAQLFRVMASYAPAFGMIGTLVGLINLPIVHYSVEWWNTLHQPASVTRLDAPGMHLDILLPLLACALGFALLFAALVLSRLRAAVMERRIRALELARARRAEAAG